MTNPNEEHLWGFHINETIYSLSGPPCPKWANSWEQQNWQKLGVVVWDAQISRATLLHGSQAVRILDHSRQFDTWKKDGLLVGEVAYRMTIPSNKKSKKKSEDQTEMKPLQEDGWCLNNTIQLSPDQARQFLSFLEQQETSLERVVKAEESERRKILAQVYSLILSWGVEREKSSDSIKTKVIQETKSVSRSAASIPNGKYLTVTQVAETCGVNEKTVSAWIKKGLLKGIDLPGLGQIVEEKDLEKYLAEKQSRS